MGQPATLGASSPKRQPAVPRARRDARPDGGPLAPLFPYPEGPQAAGRPPTVAGEPAGSFDGIPGLGAPATVPRHRSVAVALLLLALTASAVGGGHRRLRAR